MTLNYNGHSINYKSSGIGNTIVLLHGFTESLNIWSYFSSKLSQNYRVIRIDLPGHGKSDCIGDIHTMDAMAEVVKEVLNKERVRKCVMIGHSMGGYVAMAFAAKYASKLAGVGLFHSSAACDTDEQKKNRTRAIEIISNNHFGFLSSFIPDLFAPSNRELFSEDIKKLIADTSSMTTQGVVAAMAGMRERNDHTELLKNLNIPVLLIGGHQDTRIPVERLIEQATMPKEATMLLLKDAAHMGYLEARSQTLLAVRSFAQRCL